MHLVLAPECSVCMHLVLPFSSDSPLVEWGYCLLEVNGQKLPDEELSRLEEEVRQGSLQRLLAGEFGLFQAADQGCESFSPLGDH